MIKALIFDFDGVIADTYELNYTLSKELLPYITEQDFKDHHNGNVIEKPVLKFSPEEVLLFREEHKKRLKVEHLFPVVSLFEKLSEKCLLFVVSSSAEDSINSLLDRGGYSSLFKEVLGVNAHPSKIEKFNRIFDKNNLKADECLFVTDTIGDIKEARKLNLKTIAVTWGFHERELLKSEEPFALVDTAEELEEVIEKEKSKN